MELEKFSFLSHFSEDGNYYFVKTTEERLMVFNVLSSKNFEILYPSNIKSTASFIKISKPFQETNILILAVGFVDGTLLVYNLTTKKVLFSDKLGNNETIADIQFCYESDSLALFTFNQRLVKYDLKSHQVTFNHVLSNKLPLSNCHLKILKNETNVILTLEKKMVIFDLFSKEITHKFQTNSKPITFLATNKNSKILVTYSDEAIFNVLSWKHQSPILSLKGLGNYPLKNLSISKIKKLNYFIFAQYNEVIQLWLIEISLKFTQSKVIDSYVIRTEKKETINNSAIQKAQDIILSIGHHSNLKFIVLNNIIEKTTGKFNRKVLENEIHKLQWVLSEPVKKKETKKIIPNASQINEEHTHVHGDLDLIKEKTNFKNQNLSSQITKELTEFVDKNNVVESLSLHLSQSIISNDQEMIDYCLKSSDDVLIQNTIENLKTALLAPLLDILVVRIVSSPNKSKVLIKWLKYLLKTHTSYFIGCATLREKFGNLKAILLNKTRNFQKLNDLRTKISLIKTAYFIENGIELNEQGRRKRVKTNTQHKPLFIYEEGELEKHEENVKEITEKNNDYVDVSISDEKEMNEDEEFEQALKARNNDEEIEKDEEFIGFE